MAIGNIKGIIVEIGGDTSNLQKALTKVNSATSSLSKELRGINSLLKLDPKNTELLAQKQKVLSENIETTKQKLEQLKDIESKALEAQANGQEISEVNFRNLQREIISTQNKLKAFLTEKNVWITNGKNIEEYGKKIESLGKKIDGIGTKLTKVLTSSILGIGTISSKAAIDFETAFTGVEKTVDGTKEQMEELKQGIKSMAKTLPSATTEISAVAESAGQLGIKTENILTFTKTMIDMGNSTNLASDEAASALARFANITQMSQKDFNKLGSAIVDLGNNFATTESEIVDMALRLAGAGHQVGMSEGQILGLATALSSVGIEAEMGGSALSKAMVKMQNAAEMGGEKLQSVLKKAGMSLRELELLSANDSMGFKSLASSISMTSTELKQFITAGTNLEDFAKISGMTAEQFKKAWKDDATGALTSFIKGLGDAESKGDSAITMLTEMGLTETRLRDSLLRAANAGNLFNNAIETGTKAWKENVALTNEANKRYATTESKFKIALNKLQDLGIKLGDKLLPILVKLLDKAEKCIDKLNEIDNATLENIIRIGLLIATLGPAIKIIGNLTTAYGIAAKGIGKVTQKIGEFDVKTKLVSTTTGKAASSVLNFSGKLGLVVAGTITVINAMMALDSKINESFKNSEEKTKKIISSLKEEVDARSKNIESIENNLNANLSETNNLQTLRIELNKLTDANGKVINGYESRANFILNELNKALGTEYKMTNDQIENYRKLADNLNELINKKKAQIILEANEEKYKNAIKNKTKAYEDYIKTQEELVKVKYRMQEIDSAYYVFEGSRLNDLKKAEKQYNNLSETLSKLSMEIKTYDKDINMYEENSRRALEGGAKNYSDIVNSINSTSVTLKDNQGKNLNESIKNTQAYIQKQKDYYNIDLQNNIKSNNDRYNENIKAGQNEIKQLTEKLIAMTNTVEELSPSVVEAWVNLAQNSRTEYEIAISQMPPLMQEKINEITAFVKNDISVKDSVKKLGEDAVKQLDLTPNFTAAGENWIKGITLGINNKLLRQKALSSMHSFGVEGLNAIATKAWEEHSPSKATEKAAINLLKGIPIGINKEKSKTINKMLNFGEEVMSKFSSLINLNLDSFGDVSSVNASLRRSIHTTLQPKILQPNIVINTQHLDNAEMNKIIDTVNRRFGMQI